LRESDDDNKLAPRPMSYQFDRDSYLKEAKMSRRTNPLTENDDFFETNPDDENNMSFYAFFKTVQSLRPDEVERLKSRTTE